MRAANMQGRCVTGRNQHRTRGPRSAAGVTLIELMIVVVIVAILTAIAFPSYQSYVVRTHRNAAAACVSQYAQFMERFYTTNLTYVGAAPVLNCRLDSNLDRYYTFAVANLTQSTYTATATPISSQATRDAACATLSVDQTGSRSISGTSDVAHCW